MKTAQQEREQIVKHLRELGHSQPPEAIRERHPEWTDDVLRLASGMFLAAADQIEAGVHAPS
jgi:hypothetical protein